MVVSGSGGCVEKVPLEDDMVRYDRMNFTKSGSGNGIYRSIFCTFGKAESGGAGSLNFDALDICCNLPNSGGSMHISH